MPALLCLIYLLVALLGYVVLSIVLGPARRHWALIAGLSFAAGAGTIGLVLFVVSLCGVRPNRMTLLVLVSAPLALLVWRVAVGRYLRAAWPGERGRFDNRSLLACGVAILLVVVFALAVRADVTPGLANIDAYGMWMFKAKVVAAEPLRPIPQMLTDPSMSFSHQDYPFGYPMLVAAIYAAIGRIDVQLGKTVVIPAFAALICVVYGVLRSMLRRADAVILTAVFAAAPIVAQNASLPTAETLFVLEHVCCLVLLLEWMRDGRRGSFIACAIFGALAAFTKNEGLALLSIVGAVAAVWVAVRRDGKLLKDWCAGAALALIILTPWLIYRRYLPHTHEDYGSKLASASTLIHGAGRIRVILSSFFGHLVEINRAGGIWLLLGLFGVVGWRAFKQPIVQLFWMLLVAHLALYGAAFIVTPWDLDVLIPMVSARLLMHAMPTAIILIGLHIQGACDSPRAASAGTS